MFKFDPSKFQAAHSHFGVLMVPCVFSAVTRNANQGYEVTPMLPGDSLPTFWLTEAQAIGSTAVINEPNFRLLPPEDRPWHAERAVHLQRIRELEAQLATRSVHYKANGTTDVFAVTFIEPHLAMLRAMVEHLDKAIEQID